MNSKLDTTINLRSGVTLPNRIALAPLTNTQSNSDGTLHDDEFNWLVSRAGHFGLISTCAAYISEEGKAWDGQLGISSDKHLNGLKKLAKGISEKGSVPLVQLHHAGAKATLSPQKISSYDHEDIKSATKDDIKRITHDFVKAALRAENAGFAGVEVHGANGYIFTQFLAPGDNPRTDQYGGDLKNRARFLRETVQAIKKEVKENFMVNVRISPVDTWSKRGLVIKDSIQVAKWLAEDGVDVIHLSLRDASGSPPFEESEVPVVQSIREVVPSEVKIAVAGGIWTKDDAQKVEAIGADIVVLGKASIIHPDWPDIYDKPDFQPNLPPWSPKVLKEVNVGNDFLTYLEKFDNLIE